MENKRLPTNTGLSFGRSLFAAIMIEGCAVLGAVSFVASSSSHAEHSDPSIMMVMNAAEQPKEIPKPKSKPIKRVIPEPTEELPPTPEPSPLAEAPPEPQPQARDESAERDREAEFADKLKSAIQAAVFYPPAARNMGFHGKARVEFMFRDGVTSRVRIVQGSGIGMIDTAALAAVGNALYPTIP
jgi:protein TonB